MLKTILQLLVIVSLFGAVVACGGEAKNETPDTVANNVILLSSDIENIDFDKLRASTTASSAESINEMETQMKTLMGSLTDEQKVQMKEMAAVAQKAYDKTTLKCVENGDNATCTYCCNPGTEAEQTMYLVKTDGKWLVDMTKK